MFGLVTTSGCATYVAVSVRQLSFSRCCLSSLEWSATPRHVCTVTASFPQSSEDSSLQTQFALTILLCPRSDTRHYGHINHYSYLLYMYTLGGCHPLHGLLTFRQCMLKSSCRRLKVLLLNKIFMLIC